MLSYQVFQKKKLIGIFYLPTEIGCLGAEDCATDNMCHGACEAHYRCVVRKRAPFCYRPSNKVHSKYSVQTLMAEKNRINFKARWLSKLAKNITKCICRVDTNHHLKESLKYCFIIIMKRSTYCSYSLSLPVQTIS